MSEAPVPVPHPARLDPSRDDYRAILQAHEAAVRHGEPTYLDPKTGYVVFTALTLAARGGCCHSGCRHCPYDAAGDPA